MADKSSEKKHGSHGPEEFKHQPGNQTPNTPQKKESQHERGHGHEKNK